MWTLFARPLFALGNSRVSLSTLPFPFSSSSCFSLLLYIFGLRFPGITWVLWIFLQCTPPPPSTSEKCCPCVQDQPGIRIHPQAQRELWPKVRAAFRTTRRGLAEQMNIVKERAGEVFKLIKILRTLYDLKEKVWLKITLITRQPIIGAKRC